MATAAMVMSIVVLMMATFAWYTLSTNPEIKGINFSVSGEQAILVSKDNSEGSYKLSESLTEDLQDCKSLVPVSTYNGEDWFVCKYDAKGDVLQEPEKDNDVVVGTQFTHLQFPVGSNEEPASEAASQGLAAGEEGSDTIFYIWRDIYLKTTEKEVNVYLTVPRSDNYEEDPTENKHYGSYVMSYHVEEGENGESQITLLDGGSETCARVGFKVLGVVENGKKDATPTENAGDLFIYEPNADRRSTLDKSLNDYRTDKYIAGFLAKDFYSKSGSNSYANVAAGEYYLPTFPVKSKEITIGDQNTTDGEAAIFPTDHLIVQKKSIWKQPDVSDIPVGGDPGNTGGTSGNGGTTENGGTSENGSTSVVNLSEGGEGETGTGPSETSDLPEGSDTPKTDNGLTVDNFNSTMIAHMGKFITLSGMNNVYPNSLNKSNTDYKLVALTESDKQSYRSSVMLTTLEKDKPQKVRLYFWIEGQDVDCWNDISSTNFLVNLEFSGQTN